MCSAIDGGTPSSSECIEGKPIEADRVEEEEEEECDYDPDADEYDPRKSEFVVPASKWEVARKNEQILCSQIHRLARAVLTRSAALESSRISASSEAETCEETIAADKLSSEEEENVFVAPLQGGGG